MQACSALDHPVLGIGGSPIIDHNAMHVWKLPHVPRCAHGPALWRATMHVREPGDTNLRREAADFDEHELALGEGASSEVLGRQHGHDLENLWATGASRRGRMACGG